MTIQEIINYVDRVKPNAFSAEDKVMWLNEVEGMVQTDVFLHSLSSLARYTYGGEWRGSGVLFPAADTVVFPADTGFSPGGVLTLSGMAEHAENAVTDKKVLAVSCDGRTLTLEKDSFPNADNRADSGEVVALFDGSMTELLVPPPYHKIYYTYLMAMIDFANGEYNKYHNTMALFNNFFTCFTRWYAQNFDPADGECLQRSCPVSAYAIALRHGFHGSETDFLASLRGNGIVSLERTKGDGSQGTVDTYTVTMTDGTAFDFEVYQGADGTLRIIVDKELSLESANPVENRAVAAAVGELESALGDLLILFGDHGEDAVAHISETERRLWNAKADRDTATSYVDGLMSAADKAKLDTVSPGANAVAVDTALSASSSDPVANFVLHAAFAEVERKLDAKLGNEETAAAAKKLEKTVSVRTDLSSSAAASFDGSAAVTPGVEGILSLDHGGTGANNKNNAARNLIERGSWTPQVGFLNGSSFKVTYTKQYGTYLKVGDMVTVAWDMTFTASGSWLEATDYIHVVALPYVPEMDRWCGVVGQLIIPNLTYASRGYACHARVSVNGIGHRTLGGAAVSVSSSNTGTFYLAGTMTYKIS